MDVISLGRQIKKALVDFQLELSNLESIALAKVDYKFELNNEGQIRDIFIIECVHFDEEEDSDKEYRVTFTTNSHNLLSEYSKEEIIKVIDEVMSQKNKTDALNKFSEIDSISYKGLDIPEEKRKARLIVNKVGGNASKNSFNYKVSLPTTWIKEMELNYDEKDLNISFENKKIIIQKA